MTSWPAWLQGPARSRQGCCLLLLLFARPDAPSRPCGVALGVEVESLESASDAQLSDSPGSLRSSEDDLGTAQDERPPYTLRQALVRKDKDFFEDWDFWGTKDPSGGFVEYVEREEAFKLGLASATAEGIYMGTDMRSKAGKKGRKSVRIQSKATYQEGLFILDLDHVPTGCGTWPAFWMYGEDETHIWPKWGEYDIFESMHNLTNVMTTLHTTEGCDQSTVAPGTFKRMDGAAGHPAADCNTEAKGQYHNQGCPQLGPDRTSGNAFNADGGGTFAAEWDPRSQQIRTWFWGRGKEPEDLKRGKPEPYDWGMPYSFFSLDPRRCPAAHFHNMRLVFDLTFCGDLAEPTFAQYCGAPHNMTCREFVAEHPENMTEAYWSIRLLDMYQRDYAPTMITVLAKDTPTADALRNAAPLGTAPDKKTEGGLSLFARVEVILAAVALTSLMAMCAIVYFFGLEKNTYSCLESQLGSRDGQSRSRSKIASSPNESMTGYTPLAAMRTWTDHAHLRQTPALEVDQQKSIVHL
eukprot:CAMPEP_0195074622 /NCGR_PEP_ID=MMETSP0448-20130528/17685_1 /TAXON_ID=66468 /ORGANISM="Heterocapsa triquestra, Strain CCMP 448" /LENGTH=522 /DNA_ID=CAMNT_0040106901 /DNA_START=16 /DNA_END=1584 /DNA_ORIENTATION=-